jgi:NAD(P)-dependent dehydrogenase (short-subunit alcohol dehydrogenase family)
MAQTSRIILITGCTKGLGRAMVDRCIEAGHTVWGCGRSVAEIGDLAQRFPHPHHFAALDVSEDQAVARWARGLLTESAAPDLVLNNAATINASAPLWEVPADEFSRVIDINIKGVANVVRHFVPAMVARQRGVIVNFSSGWGRSTSAEVAPYCATKWAIEGLTLALAQELPAGMAAIPMNPGIINTQMLQSCFGSSADQYPDAEEWSRTSVPFLLKLSAKDNGKQLSCP